MLTNKPTALFTTLAAVACAAVLAACGKSDGVHNLTVDEARRAEINAKQFFDADHPAGLDAQGNLAKKKGTFQACRPQDSNANGMVTCTGVLPTLQGSFASTTRYCGYESGKDAVIGCSDKDQK